ncbi:carnosine N-methyltransferase isoform X2 [Calliphora vicina]|uniref:carnosine N-methyltransferase isoform X2 n=1 Tax=Calliphora vicina TaxID=7373 RepID=UPI00325AD150
MTAIPTPLITSSTSANNMDRKHSSTSLFSLSNIATEPPMLTPEEEETEKKHLEKIVSALRLYRKFSLSRVNKTEWNLNQLPKRHQKMLTKYRQHLSTLRDCIDKNQEVLNEMLSENPLRDASMAHNRKSDEHAAKIRHIDMENAQSTLKAIARDWSEEGAEERKQSYQPIIDAIEQYFDPKDCNVDEVKILVPGCGLGRLSYELACRGYECEANEFSYFMLIASNFVLNNCSRENMYTLHPWVHQHDNNLRRADQVAAVRFPDVCPLKNRPTGILSVVAGDFLEVYKNPDTYNCVATCFFIDCANNVVDFIETIYHILVPGGIWINLGPLLYHFSDIQNEESIEPTFEDIMLVITGVGFEVLSSKTGVRTKYAQNPQSMLKSEYESLFWICRKPLQSPCNDDDNVNEDDDENGYSYSGGFTGSFPLK